MPCWRLREMWLPAARSLRLFRSRSFSPRKRRKRSSGSSRQGSEPPVTGAAEHAPEERVHPGQEILLCGCTGLEGTLRILDEAENELRSRFVPSFLAGAKAAGSELVLPQTLAGALALRSPGGERLVTAARQIGSGGILAALWDLAEAAQIGLEVDMSLMTLRQVSSSISIPTR